MSKLHQIFSACCLWLGIRFTALEYIILLPVLWMTSYLSIISQADASKVSHREAAPDQGGVWRLQLPCFDCRWKLDHSRHNWRQLLIIWKRLRYLFLCYWRVSADADGPARPLRCTQSWTLSVINGWQHVASGARPSTSPSLVNNRRPLQLVNITLADVRRAVAKFSQPTVWEIRRANAQFP